MTTPTLHTISARFLAEVEHAAQQMEQQLQGPVIESQAYRQGQQDERARIRAQLQGWRDSLPSDRLFTSTRQTLDAVLREIKP
jgi:hypothetical protein